MKLIMACRFHGISPDEIDCPNCPTPDDCDISPTWIKEKEDDNMLKFRIGIEKGLTRPPEGTVVHDEFGCPIGIIKDYFNDERGALWANVDLHPDAPKPDSDILWYTKEDEDAVQ